MIDNLVLKVFVTVTTATMVWAMTAGHAVVAGLEAGLLTTGILLFLKGE